MHVEFDLKPFKIEKTCCDYIDGACYGEWRTVSYFLVVPTQRWSIRFTRCINIVCYILYSITK